MLNISKLKKFRKLKFLNFMNFPMFGSILPPHGLNLISCKPVTEVKFFTPGYTYHSHADKASSVFISTYPLLFFLIHRQGTFSSTGSYKFSLSSCYSILTVF